MHYKVSHCVDVVAEISQPDISKPKKLKLNISPYSAPSSFLLMASFYMSILLSSTLPDGEKESLLPIYNLFLSFWQRKLNPLYKFIFSYILL